jgi:GT2 family glycosyltransferase
LFQELKPKVAILVLNYNGKYLLKTCLNSLKYTLYPNYEIYVIDNGSSDGSVEYISQNFQQDKLISFNENFGFCKAYNKAARLVKADYLLFLNNDIIIKNPDWLDNMMQIILHSSKVGAVGAKLLIANNPELIENVGGTMYIWQGGTRIGFGEKDRGQYDNPPINVFYTSGAALLIKKEVFIKMGGFDSEMFAYSEDLDLCWRLRLMNYKIKYCPQAVLLHASSASWRKSKSSLFLAHRNFLRASIKNYSVNTLIKEIIPFFVVSLAFVFGSAILMNDVRFLSAITRSVGYNILHLNSTLKARKIVQSKRELEDNVILDTIKKQKVEGISTLIKKIKAFV